MNNVYLPDCHLFEQICSEHGERCLYTTLRCFYSALILRELHFWSDYVDLQYFFNSIVLPEKPFVIVSETLGRLYFKKNCIWFEKVLRNNILCVQTVKCQKPSFIIVLRFINWRILSSDFYPEPEYPLVSSLVTLRCRCSSFSCYFQIVDC